MTNSMDPVLVKYGVSIKETDSAEKRQQKLKKAKTVTIPEFLSVSPSKLNKVEKRIQRAARLIYDLNGQETPLYRKFSTFHVLRRGALVIDITTAGCNETNGAAAYIGLDNRIVFRITDDPDYLVDTLAHELKHAEQCNPSGGCFHSGVVDAYAFHQIRFLEEAQAFACGGRAYYEIFGKNDTTSSKVYEKVSKRYTNASGRKNFKIIEEEMVRIFLDKLYKGYASDLYKDAYDMEHPIGKRDTGLTYIPKSFHLSQKLMKKLNEAPRKALSFEGKLAQAKKNRNRKEYVRLLKEASMANISEEEEDYDPAVALLSGSLVTIFCLNLGILENDDMEFILSYSQKISLLKDILLAARRKRDFPFMIANALSKRMEGPTSTLNEFVSLIKNKKGLLPITSADFTDTNKLVGSWTNGENLGTLLVLRGRDGEPLIDQRTFAFEFVDWIKEEEKPNKVQRVFDSIKDKNGNLPFSRQYFEYANGILLEEMEFKYEACRSEKGKQIVLTKLNIVMGLKDENGLPMISTERIKSALNDIKGLKDIGLASDNDMEFANVLKKHLKNRKKEEKRQVPQKVIKHVPVVLKIKAFPLRRWHIKTRQ